VPREVEMKYVLQWKVRAGGSAEENLTSTQRSLEVLSKWTPSTTVLQFVARVDGAGGFGVGETDDLAALARDCAIFSPYVDLELYPVLDIEEAAAVLGSGVAFNRSV
jgi:Protein of unknown function (DUF3303)